MDLSFSGFLAGLIFSTIGLWLFGQAKSRMNPKLRWIGLVLMFYPWFVENHWLVWGLGLALCVWARREYWS